MVTVAMATRIYLYFLRELFNEGRVPYPELNNRETIENIMKGYRLPQPNDCPASVYELMMSCWHGTPEKRPTFKDILLSLVFRGIFKKKSLIDK